MFALCTTEAKLHCLTLVTLSHLLDCAQMFRAPGLQMNSIKALTSLAESPKGQITLRRNIHRVQDIRPADEIVKRHKDILLTIFERKDVKPAEIFRQLRDVYGEDMMSEGMVRKTTLSDDFQQISHTFV
ncbi:hypothetical protein J6590_026947 [Homalodisca vitripennis]|nr:hypothetical protein J6590_026947 [Homalodisca vitripennis]